LQDISWGHLFNIRLEYQVIIVCFSSGNGGTFDGQSIFVNIISAAAAVSVRGSASCSEVKDGYGRILRTAVAFHLLGSDLGLKLKDRHRASPWQSDARGSLTLQFCLLSR
jgi:hypothetical protein